MNNYNSDLKKNVHHLQYQNNTINNIKKYYKNVHLILWTRGNETEYFYLEFTFYSL